MAVQKQPFEATLHDLVYSIDAGTGLKIIRVTVYCLLVFILMAMMAMTGFGGLDNEAAMDRAQLGRNLSESGRYVTQVIRPVSMMEVASRTFNADPMLERHPELFHPPVYPAVLAVAFRGLRFVGVDLFPGAVAFEGRRVYPAELWVILPLNLLFMALSGLMVYLLGRRLFSQKIAFLGVTIYFLTEAVWQDVLRADGLTLTVFLALFAVWCAIQSTLFRRERVVLWKWGLLLILSAMASAGAVLTHYAAWAVVPGIALFIVLMGTRGQRSMHLMVFYLALLLAAVSPWMLHVMRYSGSPFGLAPYRVLFDTPQYPADSWVRTMATVISPLEVIAVAREVWAERFSALYTEHMAALGGGLLTCFFLITFFYRFVRAHVSALRWGLFLSLLLLFIGAGAFGRDALRWYHLFRPFVILYGLAFFSILLDRLDIRVRLYEQTVTGLLVVFSILPFLFLFPQRTSAMRSLMFARAPYPPYFAPFAMRVSELLEPGEVICSDIPWATAWYGRRFSILLPQTIDEFYEMNEDYLFISGLYLTTLTKDRPFVSGLLDGPDSTWLPISMGRLPPDFPLRHGFALARQDQLFLTDRIRWGAGSEDEL